MCVPGYRFWLRSAIPGWGSRCVCVGLAFSCTPLFLVGVLGRVASCLHPIHFPPPFGGSACGVGSSGGCHGWGFSPPPFSFFSGLRGGRVVLDMSCRGFDVFAAAFPGLGPLALRPPFPFRLGRVCFCFFCRPPATSLVGCAPACPGCPLLRPFGGHVVLVGRCSRLGVARLGTAVLRYFLGGPLWVWAFVLPG